MTTSERGPTAPRAFRPDIQALRGVAVALVVAYHLWPAHLPGGFVGVDVFFVISGFLIGGHLLGELQETGRLHVGRFWARRARRLLPASLLVLAAVTVATLTLAPLSTRRDFLQEVVGSVLYVQNWVLADRSVDYLALSDAASPVQHFWSLAVEEQLYLALPLLLLALALPTRRWSGRRTRRLAVSLLTLVTVASLVWSVVSTRSDETIAYFSTATRAWEFLAGTLVACVAARPGRIARVVLGVAGAVIVLASALLVTEGAHFPGAVATIPVGGTVLVLLARDTGPVAWLARLRPARFLGDISYAVYLWHWPMIVLVPYATGHDLTDAERVRIVLATLAVATASTFVVERPLRLSADLLGGARRGLAVASWGLVASALVAGIATVGAHASVEEQQRQFVEARTVAVSLDPSCLGASAAHGTPPGCPDLGDTLYPPPGSVDLDIYNRTECWATFGVADLHLCGFGSSDPGAPRVLAVGDSHNNLFLVAYEQLAARFGWHVDLAGKAGCSWSAAPQMGRSASIAEECNVWKQQLNDHIAASTPYDVILTTADANGYLAQPDGGSPRQSTVAGLHEAWAREVARGTAVVTLLDYPRARDGVVECVEAHPTTAATDCDNPPSAALPAFDAAARAAAETPGVATVDLRNLFCDPGSCAPVIGNVVVYRNPDHLTTTFVRSLVPYLALRIPPAIARARASAATDVRG